MTRIYGGQSATERRDERRARFLAAGLQVAGTDSWAATTVRAVCAEAGLTARYFYESFDDRESLLLAVFDDAATEVAQRVLAAVAAAPGGELGHARAAIGAAVDVLVEDPRKASVLFTEAPGVVPLARRRADALRAFSALVAEQARVFYGLEANDRILKPTAVFVTGGLVELVRAWIDGEIEASREEIIDLGSELLAARNPSAR